MPLQLLGQSSGRPARTNQSPSTTTTQVSLASSVQTSKESLTPSAPSSTRSPASTAQPDQSTAKTQATRKQNSTLSNHQPTRLGTATISPSATSKASHQSGTIRTPNHTTYHTVQTSQSDAMSATTAQYLSGNGRPTASQSPTTSFQRNQADSTGQGSQSSTSAASPSQSAGSTVPTQETPSSQSATKSTLQSQLGRTSLGQPQLKETLQRQSPTSSWTSTSAAPNSHTPAIIMHDHLKSDESSSPSQIQASQSAPLPTTTATTRSATTFLFNSSTPVSDNQVSSVLNGSQGQPPVGDLALNKQMKDEALRLLIRRRAPGRRDYIHTLKVHCQRIAEVTNLFISSVDTCVKKKILKVTKSKSIRMD